MLCDHRTCDSPRLIEYLRSKRVRDIACGSAHSACITSNGELYTWGLGEYGRLGHGDNTTQLRPKLVKALAGKDGYMIVSVVLEVPKYTVMVLKCICSI